LARKPLEGPLPLLPLALKPNGELDLLGLKENIRFLKDSHIPGFIAFGSMGEFYAVSEQEFNTVVDTAMENADGLVAVIGATFQNTAESIRRTKYAEDAGADGVMIAPPYVIGIDADTVFKHYRAINNASKEIQIMVYNYPPLPNINIGPEIWDKLLTLERIKAVKDSNGDVYHRTVILNKISRKINFFSGCEAWFLFDAMMGAKGIVSVFGASIPKTVMEFYNQCRNGEWAKALDWHYKFVDACYTISATNEVAWLKAAAELGGRKAGPPRPPYDNQPLDAAVRDKLKKLIESGA
jgi:4-hydroxy-tetrahydrodipicolinate synthase